MPYLMIQNPGVAPLEAFTLLGASTKRGSDNSATIGKFGTGNKHGVAVLLRHSINPVVYAGNLRMEFGTRPQEVDGYTFNRVFVSHKGKLKDGSSKSSSEDLGYVLEHGSNDWKNVELALREFVSNSLDRASEEDSHNFLINYLLKREEQFPGTSKRFSDGEYNEKEAAANALREHVKVAQPHKDVIVEVVADNQVRAKAGYTRVFVPLTSEVLKFKENLGKWFLHFSEPHLLSKRILMKNNRNLVDGSETAVIYRRGVRVRELPPTREPSLFDYNLEELPLDESRQASDWDVTYYSARALALSSKDDISLFLHSLSSDKVVWESKFDDYGLMAAQDNKEAWKQAQDTLGENTVLCTAASGEMVRRKGYRSLNISDSLMSIVTRIGLRTSLSILSEDDREGREVKEATPQATSVVRDVWAFLSLRGATNGRDFPAVKIFSKIMQGGAQTLGYYKDRTVFLNTDLLSDGPPSQQLMATAFEEVAHHVTGATDNSRDFQDFFINLLAKEIFSRPACIGYIGSNTEQG